MNVIMGREWIHAVKGVVSTLHQVMRCQSPDGLYMIDIKGDMQKAIVDTIRDNKDVFTWTYNEMLGLDSILVTHKLVVEPTRRLVKQLS